jgi:hypothetical protein
MGLLSWLNRAATGIEITDRGYARADRAARRGAAGTATIVGIEYTLDESSTKRLIAVDDGAGASGIELGTGTAAAQVRLHLGAEVRIRADGDRLVLDGSEISQKLRRKPPAPGVVDKAVTSGERKRLKKWTPRRATIVALSRRDSVLGPTLNYVTLRLEDGSHALAHKTEIPFYAAWFAAPGADVPVAVEGDRAVVDWAAAANEPGRPVGGLDDPPPAGSAAEALTPYRP